MEGDRQTTNLMEVVPALANCKMNVKRQLSLTQKYFLFNNVAGSE